MDNNRYCVIMCGGVGSRFWPYSRANMPKQFIDFFGTGRSLLQMSVDRIKGIVPDENIIMMTNEQYAGIIAQQLPQLKPDQILLEPARRNTAPCIAWAAWHIKALNPQAQIMVAPSDHLILKTDEYRDCVNKAFEFIESNDSLLTMGIKPNRPETGYGYIQAGKNIHGDFNAVKTFTEKPNEDLARVFLKSGDFYWNSGMFFWSVDTIINAMRNNAPDIASIFDGGAQLMATDAERDFIEANYPLCRNISIDYAVMEPASLAGNVYTFPADFGWSDLGNWASLYEKLQKDENGNAVVGNAKLFDCLNCVVHTEDARMVILQGLDGYIVSQKNGQVLICKRSEEQRIKEFTE